MRRSNHSAVFEQCLQQWDDSTAAYQKAISLLSDSATDQKLKIQYSEAIIEVTETKNLAVESRNPNAAPDYKTIHTGVVRLGAVSGCDLPWDLALEYVNKRLIPDLQAGKVEAWDSSAWPLVTANHVNNIFLTCVVVTSFVALVSGSCHH